jgi:hypothetical protein
MPALKPAGRVQAPPAELTAVAPLGAPVPLDAVGLSLEAVQAARATTVRNAKEPVINFRCRVRTTIPFVRSTGLADDHTVLVERMLAVYADVT